jgi:hypothetical protein
LLQNVPLEAAHLFDLNAAILGWLLATVQLEKAASAAQWFWLKFLPFFINRTCRQSQEEIKSLQEKNEMLRARIRELESSAKRKAIFLGSPLPVQQCLPK